MKSLDSASRVPLRSLLSGIVALAVAMGIGRFAYTPILPAMQRMTHLTTGQAGFLASANYAGYLIGALMAALIPRGGSPKTSRRTPNSVLTVSLGMVILTTGLMASTSNIVAWSAIRFLAGLASAGVFVLASGQVLDLLRRYRSLVLSGWLYSGVGVGIALSGVVVRIVDGAGGWRGDWLALCLLATALIALTWRWLPTAATTPVGAQPVPMTAGRGPGLVFALLLFAYFLEGTGYIVTGTFLVTIVDGMPGLSSVGPSLWIVVGLAAAPSCILWARVAGRVGYAPTLIVAYVAQACGIVLPAVGAGWGIALAAALLFGGTFMGITVLTLTLAGQIAPRQSGRVIGVLTAAFGLGQIIGPLLVGALVSHTHSFNLILLTAAALVMLAGSLMAVIHLVELSRRHHSI